MFDFLIQCKNAKIQVSRIIEGRKDIIIFLGEISIPINYFWVNFKNKVEHLESDEFAFIIATDQSDYISDFIEDSNIKISDKFVNSYEDVIRIVDDMAHQRLTVLLYREL